MSAEPRSATATAASTKAPILGRGFSDDMSNCRLAAKDQLTHGGNMSPLQKPGEMPNSPGEYVERGPRGGQVPKPRQVTIEPGDNPLPPTQEGGRTWERIGPPQK